MKVINPWTIDDGSMDYLRAQRTIDDSRKPVNQKGKTSQNDVVDVTKQPAL